jgi:hypothetical protein
MDLARTLPRITAGTGQLDLAIFVAGLTSVLSARLTPAAR